MRKLILKLIQKYFLKTGSIKPGDLVEHVDDTELVVEALGVYYNFYLHPFLFYRTKENFIACKALHEFKRVSDVDKLLEAKI